MAKIDKKAIAISMKYTKDTANALGAVKGAPCQIKSIVKKDGQNIVTFLWIGDDGTELEGTMIVEDGTPIYVWEPGKTYKYGDLVIYESAFYRCIAENSDLFFDNTKYNEIGSADGNYDIVEKKEFLPARFTAADRKLYYSIEENIFYLWDGTGWKPQTGVVQYPIMPVARELFADRVVQYIGDDTTDYKSGYFYKCVHDTENDTYSWRNLDTMEVDELTETQMNTLLSYL